MFNLFKKKEKIKKELPPGTIRKEFHFEGNVQNIGFRFRSTKSCQTIRHYWLCQKQ